MRFLLNSTNQEWVPHLLAADIHRLYHHQFPHCAHPQDGVYVCRSEFESPEVDGEILVKYDKDVMQNVEPYSLIGEFIKVKITGADEYDLIAEPIELL